MPAHSPIYKRLPGKRVSLFSRDTVWMADDHILAVHSYRFTERYRRFYFRDIQAIAIQPRANTGLTILDATLLTAALAMIVVTWMLTYHASSVFLAIISVPYGISRVFRRTCTVWIQTAVSVEKLPAFRRVRPAMKALAIIEQRVRESQPDVAPSWSPQPTEPGVSQ